MNKEVLELFYEFEDIIEIEENGYENVVDIHIDTEDKLFLLSNGIVSHNSAMGGISPVLGKEEFGYFVLRGKPLNAWEISTQKLSSNEELSTLYKILQNEKYEKIVIISDADVDGKSINSLLFAFFCKFVPNYMNKLYRMNTPIAAELKNNKPYKWVYNFQDIDKLSNNAKYYKGLGSWKQKDLEYIIKQDGFENMLVKFEFEEEDIEYLDKWFNSKRSDDRKEAILNNDFNIVKV